MAETTAERTSKERKIIVNEFDFQELCYNRKKQNSEDNKKDAKKVMLKEVTNWHSALLESKLCEDEKVWSDACSGRGAAARGV